ncbi:hypothetical protein [Rugosimonospora africana]|uniref:DUF11 domain-containing protein n=1 Tax=Rugosimonospora africana TaxID=556532 RepID=A0A8J3QQK6_9ACTN|nr:hypothetical protein [Rugosimonospora africana]GIH14719.1 hypothetical protein Raf01_28910 [Rugosimonospora africana]
MRALRTGRRLRQAAVIVAAATGMVVAGAGAAHAATAQLDRHVVPVNNDHLSVTSGPLVLSYDGTHYFGDMRLSVTNDNPTAVSDANLSINVPAGLVVTTLSGASGCVGSAPVSCGVDTLQPGTTTVTVSFGSFAAPAGRARVTADGSATVTRLANTAHPSAREKTRFHGVLASTSGSVSHPVAYQPAAVNDLGLSAGTASVTRQDDGSYTVRVPVTALDKNDAANQTAWIEPSTTLPNATFTGTDPAAPCTIVCSVPGSPSWMSSGESRSVAVLYTVPAGTAPGVYEVTVYGVFNFDEDDATPADNTVTVSVTIPE